MALLGPAVGYVDLLNHETTRKLKQEKESGVKFKKTPLRPSAAGNCTRELAFQLAEYTGLAQYETEVNTPESHRLLALGHDIEAHLVRQLKVLEEFVELRYKQQALSFGWLEAKKNKKLSQWLEGSLDMVFWSDKWKCVADVKSKKDKFHAFYKTDWDGTTDKLKKMQSVQAISDTTFWVEDLEAFLEELHDPFFAANFLQLNLYANAEFLKERGVNHACIIQYSKNDSRLREIRFKPSRAVFKRVMEKFQAALDAIDEGNPDLAPRDFVLGSIKCAFCKYQKPCWGKTVNALQAFFDSLPDKKWPKDTNRMGRMGKELDELFASFEKLEAAEAEKVKTERQILKMLSDEEVFKIRPSNGKVYEVKSLKTGLALRRGKV